MSARIMSRLTPNNDDQSHQDYRDMQPRLTTVVEEFERQALSQPDATALRLGTERYSYDYLNRRANQLAHALLDRGVKPASAVAIVFSHGVEMVSALLAILKAGCAYVPLDPNLPAARLAYLVRECGAALVLTGFGAGGPDTCDPQWQEATAGRLLDIAQLIGPMSELPACALPIAVGADDLLCILYTSGSTGVPKGVELTQLNVANCLHWMQSEYQLQASDVMLHKTPYSFDVSMYELFWPLMVGAQVTLAEREGYKDPEYLVGLIGQAGVSAAHFVPSMLLALLEQPEITRCQSLKQVFAAGEALSYPLTQRFFQRLPRAALHNLYGPTECGVVSHWGCRREDARASVPIGYAVANITLHVLDTQGQTVAAGTEGELFIGGAQVARGYAARPDLSAASFIQHPQFGRLYKSGDIVAEMLDGALEYKGRRDLQVKLRGQRLELGEIEARLLALEEIAEAVCGVRERAPADAWLVAWVMLRPGRTIDIASMRQTLAQQLPEYMVPQLLVPMQDFPRATSGKIDRHRLPDPFPSDGTRRPITDPPQTRAEQLVATLWGDALGIKQLSRGDRFADLGGHSLLAVKISSQLRARFGRKLPMRTMLMESLASVALQLVPDEPAIEPTVDHGSAGHADLRQAAFYFGAAPRPLLGIVHCQQRPRSTAILICHSLGPEYMRSYRALKLLADRLAQQGFAVMRFDYACTGDSVGYANDARVEEWLDNIRLAGQELLVRSGADQICVIGLRIGALLARQAAGNIPSLRSLLGWDEPPSGQHWLEQTERLNRQFHKKWNRQRPWWAKLAPPIGVELHGMLFSETFSGLQSLTGAAAIPSGVGTVAVRSADFTDTSRPAADI
ncbi:MAG TPA: amino acid adenylation domain-containing protein, partial [Steroidobacteraceae bacterium]